MLFVTFEGIDGSGKTTQIDKLGKLFGQQGQKTLITSEPARHGIMGDAIYKIIKENKESTPICDLLLVYTLRNLHVKNVIMPALTDGKLIICSRYVDSSVAYYARTMTGYEEALSVVLDLHRVAAYSLMPSLTFLLDLSAEEAANRIAYRSGIDKFDNMKIEEMESIRKVFLHNAVSGVGKDRTHIIDGTQSEVAIFDEIARIISLKLQEST